MAHKSGERCALQLGDCAGIQRLEPQDFAVGWELAEGGRLGLCDGRAGGQSLLEGENPPPIAERAGISTGDHPPRSASRPPVNYPRSRIRSSSGASPTSATPRRPRTARGDANAGSTASCRCQGKDSARWPPIPKGYPSGTSARPASSRSARRRFPGVPRDDGRCALRNRRRHVRDDAPADSSYGSIAGAPCHGAFASARAACNVLRRHRLVSN
jgi:hypothetical protein